MNAMQIKLKTLLLFSLLNLLNLLVVVLRESGICVCATVSMRCDALRCIARLLFVSNLNFSAFLSVSHKSNHSFACASSRSRNTTPQKQIWYVCLRLKSSQVDSRVECLSPQNQTPALLPLPCQKTYI